MNVTLERRVVDSERMALTRGTRIVCGVVVAAGVVTRFVTPSHLWLDEALTVNIARLPLNRMGDALRHDGAPPLFYVLLHGWMNVFGEGDVAVRALSGVMAVVALPLMWLAGRRLGGTRVAWAATALLAASPFAARYGTEARMYSMVVLLVLAGYLGLARLLERRSRPASLVLGLSTGMLLLTHYWSLYLGLVLAATLGFWAWRHPEDQIRAGARRALGAMAAGSALFLPWLGSFAFQAANTGTPWGRPASARSLVDTVFHFAGGYWDPGLGLGLGYFALMALGFWGRAVDGGSIQLDLRGRAPGRALALVAFGTLVVAIVAGQLTDSAFAVRYAAVVFPLMLLLAALGLDVLSDPRVFVSVLCGAVILGFAAMVPNLAGDRTTAGRVAAALRSRAAPGDVVAYCPDQLGPSVSRLLPSRGLQQVTFPRSGSPQLVDWVGYADANRRSDASEFARGLLARAGPTHDVWVVWAPGYRTFATKCQLLLSRLRQERPGEQRVVKIGTATFERPGLVRYPPG